jgi:hypothetical protein
VWQAKWTAEVEKATDGRVKFQALAKHPSAPSTRYETDLRISRTHPPTTRQRAMWWRCFPSCQARATPPLPTP